MARSPVNGADGILADHKSKRNMSYIPTKCHQEAQRIHFHFYTALPRRQWAKLKASGERRSPFEPLLPISTFLYE